MKKLLCLDFDGVIHSYTSGWQGIDQIPDPPVEEAFEFIAQALKRFDVAIFSSRSCDERGILAMKEWMLRWAVIQHFDQLRLIGIKWPMVKPSAWLTIDDRCWTFDGNWSNPADLLDKIDDFKPWNR